MKFLRKRRQAKAQARRRVTLRLALFSRQELLVAIDEASIVDVVVHLVAALDALNSGIEILAEQVYPGEVNRPAIYAPDRVPTDWN